MNDRIYLSPPHMSGKEQEFVNEAFADNWIAPVGPHLTAFEQELCNYIGADHAVALSSGTAGIHLGLQLLGVQSGDEIVVSDMTFIGSVYPVNYIGATPVFIDSEAKSRNMDPELLEKFLEERARKNNLPKAVIVVHLYGQSADMDSITSICQRFEIPILEDAAEALGTIYKDHHVGAGRNISVFSFNGNKIITTSGGGMLVSNDQTHVEKARHLATQAREPVAHYEHTKIGYNYRLSNILAGVGRGQLRVLDDRVSRKREIFDYYHNRLGDLPGIDFMPEASWGLHTRWLTVMMVDSNLFGAGPEAIRLALEANNIEARPTRKPMHMQPIYEQKEFVGSGVSRSLFETGLCLPSGTAMSESDLDRIISVILECRK